MPPWYYGFAYEEFYAYRTVFYPIPINFLVAKYRWLKMKFDSWRGTSDPVTTRIRRISKINQHRFYSKGYNDGMRRGVELMRGINP